MSIQNTVEHCHLKGNVITSTTCRGAIAWMDKPKTIIRNNLRSLRKLTLLTLIVDWDGLRLTLLSGCWKIVHLVELRKEITGYQYYV